MQYFTGDETELKVDNVGAPILNELGLQRDDFFENCYDSFILGGLIWDSGRSPLANAIPREIFREAFTEIFNTFKIAGTFESYLDIFRKIFGESVDVQFTVPAPGKLIIDIEAQGVELYDFITRYIEDNDYKFDDVIDDEGDEIVFQSIKGMESQYEVEQMLFELVPAGIYTDINLTIGG